MNVATVEKAADAKEKAVEKRHYKTPQLSFKTQDYMRATHVVLFCDKHTFNWLLHT